MLITLKEYALRHNRNPDTVRQKALRGTFNTAVKIGRDWLIDEDEPYTDRRKDPETAPESESGKDVQAER